MNETRYRQAPILVVGTCRLTSSLAVCLLQAGHRVTLCSPRYPAVEERMEAHLAALGAQALPRPDYARCESLAALPNPHEYPLAIAITPERVEVKTGLIRQLEALLAPDALLAFNTESIPLDDLQRGASQPGRVIGANWTEPAHTTLFLEIITNARTHSELSDAFCETARTDWGKDPYVLRDGGGIRTRLLCALLREAFFLVQNGYVSVEGVDRCCRNDAGYYLPFAGNFRYMDLMGTYIYGLVMQDLNPELTKTKQVPPFFEEIIRQGGQGMANGRGFYAYAANEPDTWESLAGQFSYQIADLMRRYPFPHAEEPRSVGEQSLVHE